VLLPLWLVGAASSVGLVLAMGSMLVGAVAVRSAIVQMPHRLAEGRTGGRMDGPITGRA
jgi:hypothetical protein